MRIRVKDLLPNTEYAFQFRGNDGEAVSEWSTRFLVTTIGDPTLPAAPNNFTWVQKFRGFKADWDHITTNQDGSPIRDFDHYEVELAANSITHTSKTKTKSLTLTFEENVSLFTTAQPTVTARVRGIDKSGNAGAWTSTLSASNPVPAAPGGLTATLNGNTASLKWSENAEKDVTVYRIYDGSTLLWEGSALSKAIAMAYGSTKTFQVAAVDVFGQESTKTSFAQLSTGSEPGAPDSVAPAVPTGLTATITTATDLLSASMAASWTAVADTDVQNYILRYRPSGSSGNYTFMMTPSDVTNLNALGLPPYVNYQMAIRAVDSSGNKSAWSSNFVTTTAAVNSPPAAPSGVTGNGGLQSFTTRWTENTEVDVANGRGLYEAQLDTVNTFNSANLKSIKTGSNSVIFTQLNNGTTYYSRVFAIDDQGLASSASSTVNSTTSTSIDTSAPATPTGLAATITIAADAVTESASVSWNASSDTDLATYNIRYRPVGGSTYTYLNVPYGQTAALIEGLTSYVNYEFQIAASDFSANRSAFSATVTANAPANIQPSTPSAPSAAANNMQIQVSHDNLTSGGAAMPGDVTHYEVYASTSTPVTIHSANMLGVMRNGPAISGVWPIPAESASGSSQNWYVRVVAVDKGGLKSVGSGSTLAVIGLISGLNVAQATITSANITTLNANQIVAGTGLIYDLTVRSTLTIGNASDNGYIKSHSWVSDSAGWRLDKQGLEVNEGNIKAPALRIQDSDNIMLPQYAGFEYSPQFYTMGAAGAGNVIAFSDTSGISGQIVTSPLKYGNQALQITNVSGATRTVTFGAGASSYNNDIPETGEYIFSMWARSSVNADITLRINGDGESITTQTVSLVANTWTRVWMTKNFVSSTKVVTGFQVPTTNCVITVDGVQLEKKISGATTPSPWTAPGVTKIDGAIIRTGQIQSSVNATVGGASVPYWSIDTAGTASFANATIRGETVIGASGDNANSMIRSFNYVANSTGWKIDASGSAEFSNLLARGTYKTAESGKRIVIGPATNIPTGLDITSAGTMDSVGLTHYAAPGSVTNLNANEPGGIWFGTESVFDRTGVNTGVGTTTTWSPQGVGTGTPPRYYIKIHSDGFIALKALDIEAQGARLNLGSGNMSIGGGITMNNAVSPITMSGSHINMGGGEIRHLDGNVTFNVQNGFLRVTGDTNIAGKITAPNADCAVVWDGDKIRFTGPAYNGSPTSGNHRDIFSKSHTPLSDGRFKDIISEVTGAIDILKATKSYDYRFKGETEIRRGPVAQEWKDITQGIIKEDPDNGTLFMNDTGYISTVAQAVRELIVKVETLETQVENLMATP